MFCRHQMRLTVQPNKPRSSPKSEFGKRYTHRLTFSTAGKREMSGVVAVEVTSLTSASPSSDLYYGRSNGTCGLHWQPILSAKSSFINEALANNNFSLAGNNLLPFQFFSPHDHPQFITYCLFLILILFVSLPSMRPMQCNTPFLPTDTHSPLIHRPHQPLLRLFHHHIQNNYDNGGMHKHSQQTRSRRGRNGWKMATDLRLLFFLVFVMDIAILYGNPFASYQKSKIHFVFLA